MEHSAGVQFGTLAGRRLNGVEDVGEEVGEGEEDEEDFIVVHCRTSVDTLDDGHT